MEKQHVIQQTVPARNWWGEKNRYRDHYYPDEVVEAVKEVAVRAFIASIPFFHYLSPKLDMAIFFGIEASVIWDHTKELFQGKRAFKNLMYLVDDLLTVGSIFSPSPWPGRLATVMETGMSLHRLFCAKTIRHALKYAAQFVAQTTSLVGDLQKDLKLKWISGLARAALLAIEAETEWQKGNRWIETASNLGQMGIRLFDAFSVDRPREASLAPA